MKKAILSFIFILSISVGFISFPSFAKTIPSTNTETESITKYKENTPQYQNNAIRWRYKKKMENYIKDCTTILPKNGLENGYKFKISTKNTKLTKK